MYNVKDILTEQQKEILKKANIVFDVEIKNDEEMRKYISNLFLNLTSFKHIQEISDVIVKKHNNL